MKKIILCLVLTALIFNFSLEAYGANNSLLGKVTTDKNEYALNESVRFLFTITNSTNTPITLTFNTAQIYDFEIVKDGNVVFKWGIGRMFAQVITKVTVPANGTKAFSVIWGMVDNKGNKVDVGTYSVRFYLVNNNGAEATTTFVIGTPTFTPVFQM